MPSLTDTLVSLFIVGAVIGFIFFSILAAYGGWILVKVLTITWRVAYARWRWKRYQREMEEGNLLFANKISQEFIREINKTALTEPVGGNPFGFGKPTTPNTQTNDNGKPQSQASGSPRP
jgi:hypothetical protein